MAATDAQIAARWETWYAGQGLVYCQRCDHPMPNLSGLNYCSKECELGYVGLPYQEPYSYVGSPEFLNYKPGSWRTKEKA